MSTQPEKETEKETVKETEKETEKEKKDKTHPVTDVELQQLYGTEPEMGWPSGRGGKRTRKMKRKRRRTISKTRKKKGGLSKRGENLIEKRIKKGMLEGENSPEVLELRKDIIDLLQNITQKKDKVELGLKLDEVPVLKNRKQMGGKRKRTRKMKGGHHLYKRLGVSKYATKKTIKNAYKKLKKRNKLTSKVKHAYKILSKNKTRKQYNNKYKKHKKLKRRKRKRV